MTSEQDRADADLAAAARAAIDALAERGSTTAFQLLIELSAHCGTAIGQCARHVAEQGSWSQVASLTGTTRQAAWSRWR